VGHQVNFFVLPTDLPDLEAAIRTTGDVCFLADKSPTCDPIELATITPEPATEPQLLRTYFIVQRQELAAVSTRFIQTQDYWLIEGTESPVIEFSPGLFSGTRLTTGRAYFASDLRFRPELPSPEFVRWGDKALTRVLPDWGVGSALTDLQRLHSVWVSHSTASTGVRCALISAEIALHPSRTTSADQ
jgi:hypothetical protein